MKNQITQLEGWIKNRYISLLNEFKDKEVSFDEIFSFLNKIYGDSKQQVKVILSKINKAGLLSIKRSKQDMREKVYKFNEAQNATQKTILSKQDLINLLKKAADIIRTRVDYKFILLLLFYKALSDRWQKEFKQVKKNLVSKGWKEIEAKGKDIKEIFVLKNLETGELILPDINAQCHEIRHVPSKVALITRQKKEILIGDSCSPIFDDSGKFVGKVIVFRDITAEVMAQEEIKRSEQKFHAIWQNSVDAMRLADEKGIIKDVNDAFCKLFEIEKEAVINKPINIVYLPDAESKVMERYYERIASPEKLNQREIRKVVLHNKKEIWLSSTHSIFELGGEKYILTIFRDITEDKKLEEAIRLSEKRYATLVDSSPAGIFRTDEKGFTTFVNRRWCEISGMQADQALGNGWLEAVHPEDREKIAQGWTEAVQKEVVSRAEYRFLLPDGTIKWVAGQAVPEYDPEGRLTGFIGVVIDITEKKLAEELLRKSEERYRRLTENADDLIYRYEFFPKRGFTYVNPAATKITGYTPEEHYANPDLGLKLIHPEDRNLLEEYFKGGGKFGAPLVLRWIRKDGTIIWTEQKNVPVYDENGNLVALEGIARDITDRILAEEKIRESEETYRNLFQNAQVGLFRTRISDGKILECNEQLARMFGYDTREELIKEYVTSRNYVDPGTRERMLKEITEKGEIKNFEARFYRKDGSIFWVRYSARIYPEKGWIEGVAEDITEEKLAKEQLIESEQRFSTIVNLVPTGIAIVDKNGIITFANPAAEKILGLTKDEITSRTYNAPEWKITAIDGGPFPDENLPFSIVKRTKQPVFNVEHAIEHRDGRRIILSINAVPVLVDGKFEGMIASFSDVTELKRAERFLRELSERQEALLAAIPDIVVEVDMNKVYVWGNQAAYDFFGDDFIGKPAHYYFVGEQ
ncbi:MAG: PAS domain S-box protein, partial [Candidatus Jordarchaeaceae archaeon]